MSLDDVGTPARAHLMSSIDALLRTFVSPKSELGLRPAESLSANEKTITQSYERLRNVAEALRIWHSSDEFLLEDGSPRALARSGTPSLSSLARQVTRHRKARIALMSDLEKINHARKDASVFAPANRSAILSAADSQSLAYSTIAISRLIGTIAHNFSGIGAPRYERQVSDVDIRVSDLPIFLRFVEQQGQYLIDAVDDWLSKREANSGTEGGTLSVGLGAFAWVDQPTQRVKAPRRASAPVLSPK